MRRTILITGTLVAILTACHTTSHVSSEKTTVSDAFTPSEVEISAARTKFPNVTAEELKQGHSIYYGACTDCHRPKDITGFSEEELKGVLDRMAPKADLSASQKESVWRYMIMKRTK